MVTECEDNIMQARFILTLRTKSNGVSPVIDLILRYSVDLDMFTSLDN